MERHMWGSASDPDVLGTLALAKQAGALSCSAFDRVIGRRRDYITSGAVQPPTPSWAPHG